MRNKIWTVAPWCLCAVLLLSGADSPKPVPPYMKLMLLEEQHRTETMRIEFASLSHQLLSLQAALTNDPESISLQRDVKNDAIVTSGRRLAELEPILSDLRKQVVGDDYSRMFDTERDRREWLQAMDE